MKWFGREKAPAGPTAAEQKATQDAKDRESVLNDAKFMKSLDTHPNIDADSNLETLKQAHESFKVKETASKELQSLIKNEIKSDIGLSLDSKEGILVAEAIDKYLNGELIDNPERITELRTQIEKFHELNKKVEEQNQVLEKLGISVDALRGQNQAINKVQDTKKRFQMILGYSKEHKSARESATKEHGLSLSKLKEQQIGILAKLKTGEKAEGQLVNLMAELKGLRTQLLQDLEPMATIRELARDKAKNRLAELQDPNKPSTQTTKGLEEASKFFEKMVGNDFRNESGIDYLPDGMDADQFFEDINQNLETAFSTDMKDSIEKIKDGSLTLNKMKEVVKSIFAKEQIAGKSAEETKQYITEYLNNELMPNLPKSKQILLKAAMESFNA